MSLTCCHEVHLNTASGLKESVNKHEAHSGDGRPPGVVSVLGVQDPLDTLVHVPRVGALKSLPFSIHLL